MGNNIFDPNKQNDHVSSKIVAGLERISEVFKVLLWEKAKLVGLSPIQIQILIFVAYHKEALCNVSHLAREFNLTKPTISDAVRILDKKELIIKDFSNVDQRSYSIRISPTGEKIVQETEDFANPLQNKLSSFNATEQKQLFQTLSKLIYQLNRSGILTVQRTCYGCTFYEKASNGDYCNLLKKDLLSSDIRLDCPEFQEQSH